MNNFHRIIWYHKCVCGILLRKLKKYSKYTTKTCQENLWHIYMMCYFNLVIGWRMQGWLKRAKSHFENCNNGPKETPTNFGVFFYDICNVFTNMFNVALIMMGQSIVVVGFSSNWDMSFGKFGGLPTLVAFQKINLQGRNKLIVLSMSANEFTEVPHTIWCIIPQGIVC